MKISISRPLLHKTLAYYATYIAFGLLVSSAGPTLSDLADNTHSRVSQMGLLLAVRSVGYLAGIQGWGRLIDRFPGHPMMTGMLGLVMLMLFLTPLIPMLPLLMVVFFLLGTSESGLDVGGNTLIVWAHGDKVAPYLNGLHFCFGAGAFICPTLLSQMGGLTAGYWMVAALMLPAALLMITSSSPQIQHAKDEQGEFFSLWLVVLIAAFYFLHVGVELSFSNWLATYVTRLDLMSKQDASYLTSAYWGSITAGRLISLPLAARIKPHLLLLVDLLGALLSLGIMIVWNSSTSMIIGAIGLGLSLASLFPSTLAFAGERMTLTGKISGWFFTGSALAGIVMPPIIGVLFEEVGERSLMWALGFCIVLALGVYAILQTHPPQVLQPSTKLTAE